MLISGLVSLITPCYNGEKYVERFIKSVLLQTYKEIQLIFVDDGSTDRTADIVAEYIPALELELTEVIFLRKENGGAASAVNDALKYVRGEYLAWADCDDVLHSDNILKKVEYLNENIDKGMVMCRANLVSEETGELIRTLGLPLSEQKENIFNKLVIEGLQCCAGVFLLRTELLFKRLGEEREIIYCRSVGQNWQLLLPVSYDNECGYIQECLYDYYVRTNSHSRIQNLDRKIERTYEQEQILKEILGFLDEQEKKEIFKKIELKYIKQRINFSFEKRDKKIFEENFIELRERTDNVPVIYKKMSYLIRYKTLDTMNNILITVKGRLGL